MERNSIQVILIGAGIVLIGFALLLGFGITVSSLKEKDEDIFTYLIIPTSMIALGIFAIVKGVRTKSIEED